MEDLRQAPPPPAPPPAPTAPLTEAATDAAGVAADARARAEAVACAPAVVTITVKTTGAHATEIVATPDTTIGEIMRQACGDLGVRDAERYVLVANGEVIADATRTVRDLVGNALEKGITTRLVKRPEAGGAGSCRF